jgi:hypothetical protein
MSDISDRFDMVFAEDAMDYVEQKEKELEKLRNAAAEERIRIERKGLCEGCNTLGYNRWAHNNEFYLCAKCFIQGLQCQAEADVPMSRVDDMDEYNEYLCWQDLWENNE